MRNISPASLATLAQGQGIEPINLVQIYWNRSTYIWYADRKFEHLGITGRLLELSNLENVINITGSSNTESISIKLDDSDNTIKNIFNQNDIHKSKVYVFQWFAELPTSEAFIIFEGEISTPIIWKEGERTISFDVLSNIHDSEVGFSAEEGDFEYIPPNLVGAAWPLPFGTVLRVPCLQLNELDDSISSSDSSTSGDGFDTGASTSNLMDSYNKAFESANDCRQKAAYCFAQASNARNRGIPSQQIFVLPSVAGSEEQSATTTADQYSLSAQEYLDQALEYERQMQTILNQQVEEANSNSIEVENGNEFPQGELTTITINGVNYTGVFSGDTFVVAGDSNPFIGQNIGPLTVADQIVATEYANQQAAQTFFYQIEAATDDDANRSLYYIVSLFFVSNIFVHAKYDGVTALVPSTYYQLSYVNFGSIQATYLIVPEALSLIDSKWSDEIFCSFTSPVGPNVVDILIWLIHQYTDKTYDPTTFNVVRNQVNEYPANFVIDTRTNVLEVLKDIAFQARCSIWQKQGVFYLMCLAYPSAPIDTITEADIEFGTMEISCTESEDLVTKYEATYKLYWNESSDYRIIWRFNIAKYGLLEKSDSFYIYNNTQLAERASLFWFIRYCNTWKKLKFSTFLTKLKLETFDTVLLNFSNPWVSWAPTIAIVESCIFNSADNRIELDLWLPIRFGEMTPYPFGLPGNIDPTLIFPLEFEESSGETVGSEAEGTLYPQSATDKKTTRANSSAGGIPLSDTGFTAPEVETMIDTREIQLARTVPKNLKQFQIKPVTDPDLSFDAPGTFPGIVNGHVTGLFYMVDVYFNGLLNAPTTLEVKQMKLHEDDVIPTGTPCTVLKNKILISTDTKTGFKTYESEFTMTVPIWLASTSESSDPPPDVPVPDEGTEEEVDETGPEVDDAEPIDDEGSGDEPIIDLGAGDTGET